jgi:putative transposase
LLAVSRSSVYRQPAAVSEVDRAIMALIDRQYLTRPYYGSRRMAAWLATQGHLVNRKRVRRLMRLIGLVAIYQRPNTSKAATAHKIYRYLLGGIAIERVNQVWCSDVTYIPMAKGFLYLAYGLGEPRGAGVATFEHAQCRVLCRGARGSARPLRPPRDFQYRPG